MPPQFQLSSPAFRENTPIPAEYTCLGLNVNPPLNLNGVPEGTESLALVLHDPDAPGGDFLHWTIWNIPVITTTISEGTVPWGAVQGTNDFGEIGYGGPCPPTGTHRYQFDAYALNSELEIPVGAARPEVMQAIAAHTISSASLTGTVSAD